MSKFTALLTGKVLQCATMVSESGDEAVASFDCFMGL